MGRRADSSMSFRAHGVVWCLGLIVDAALGEAVGGVPEPDGAEVLQYLPCARSRRAWRWPPPINAEAYLIEAADVGGTLRAAFRLEANGSVGDGYRPPAMHNPRTFGLRDGEAPAVQAAACEGGFRQSGAVRREIHDVSCFRETEGSKADATTQVEGVFYMSDEILAVECRLPDALGDATEGPVAAWQVSLTFRVLCPVADCEPNIVAPPLLSLELCPHRKPRRRLSVCSQPLYGYRSLSLIHASIFQDWLNYHLAVGIEHVYIYDSDGSFEDAVRPYVASGEVSYFGRFGQGLGRSIRRAITEQRMPVCAEYHAYAHCLVRARGVSDWVQLLHTVDEYVAFPGRPARPRLAMSDILDAIASARHSRPSLWVYHVPLARMDTCGDDAISAISCSRLQSLPGPDLERTASLINPEVCVLCGAEHCRAAIGVDVKRYNRELPSVDRRRLVVLHFVELLPKNAGRCSRIMGLDCIWDLEAAPHPGKRLPSLRNRSASRPPHASG